jgi:hypothetical protein
MYIHIKQFKKLEAQIKAVASYVQDCQIELGAEFDAHTQQTNALKAKIISPTFKNLAGLYHFLKYHTVESSRSLIEGLTEQKKREFENETQTATCIITNMSELGRLKSARFIPKKVSSFAYASEATYLRNSDRNLGFFAYARNSSNAVAKKSKTGLKNNLSGSRISEAADIVSDTFINPLAILNEPIELVEGNHTYRIVKALHPQSWRRNGAGSIAVMARDDDNLYNYLDKGFFILRIADVDKKNKIQTRYVVTDTLDVNSMHIFTLCSIQPTLTESLRDGCFVHSAEAGLTRLKLEKKLKDVYRVRYDTCREVIERDYETNTNILAINSLHNGQTSKISINDITLTPHSAAYQNVSIEAQDLLEILYPNVNFGGEFDVYTLISAFAVHVRHTTDESGVTQEDKEKVISAFKINGFDISVSLTSSGVRKINNLRINKVEIAEVIHRASCYHTQKDYDLFVKRVSNMSLRRHDILSNGLAVKIHSSMSNEDLSNTYPGADAPSVKICYSPEHKCLALNINSNHIPVKLSKLIERVDTINRKTNGRWTSGYGGVPRDYRWAQKNLIEALIECTTFEKKKRDEQGVETIETVIGVTRKDVENLLKQVNENKIKAIAKSKDFMETAIRLTKAERIEFQGKPALKVVGSLRTYAVVIETAKVYDFDTKKYRCIVNDRHYQGAGYDDIAARLYALKNDSVMQKHIGTLKGDAQPNAENAHNHELPVRDVIEAIPDEVLGLLQDA